jgi:SAM-dependent methyltransferase
MANQWAAGLTPAWALELRAGFDADAEVYQRTRPVCPPALFDDLIRLAGLSPGDRVLEIAPGTGQATVPLAERGLAVTSVELGPSLAAVARRRLARFPAVEVVTSSFEDWQPRDDDAPYDAVVVCNALHWIDPEVRYAKPAALLRPGSAFAIVSCQWARPAAAEPFWTEVQRDYQAVGFRGSPPPPPDQVEPWRFPPPGPDARFDETASLRYPFEMTYAADDYLAQLSTQAGTRELGNARAADFLDRVRRRLDTLGSPALTATFVACLTIGTRR